VARVALAYGELRATRREKSYHGEFRHSFLTNYNVYPSISIFKQSHPHAPGLSHGRRAARTLHQSEQAAVQHTNTHLFNELAESVRQAFAKEDDVGLDPFLASRLLAGRHQPAVNELCPCGKNNALAKMLVITETELITTTSAKATAQVGAMNTSKVLSKHT
jgi:hypothetical protein